MVPRARCLALLAASLVLAACDSAPPEVVPTKAAPASAAPNTAPTPPSAPLGEHAGMDHAAHLAAQASADAAPPDPAPPPRREVLQPGEMVQLPGGTFRMGTDEEPDSQPIHEVTLDPFQIDVTEVTNGEMERFVRSTRYVTTAEKDLDPKLFPDVPKDKLKAGSLVVVPPEDRSTASPMTWWRWVPGANFRHPEGPSSSIQGKERHPVVHVSWDDAVAFCKWKGKRLPTEAEWEYAARGGLVGLPYSWGAKPQGPANWRANTWQGDFPFSNTAEDGFATTAPVGSFPPNGFGLYDMSGNVWEWVADWYRPDAYATSEKKNPRGPAASYDPQEPGMPKHVQRGGSFVCADSYCVRYKVGGRGKSSPDSSHYHTGFRCAK